MFKPHLLSQLLAALEVRLLLRTGLQQLFEILGVRGQRDLGLLQLARRRRLLPEPLGLTCIVGGFLAVVESNRELKNSEKTCLEGGVPLKLAILRLQKLNGKFHVRHIALSRALALCFCCSSFFAYKVF